MNRSWQTGRIWHAWLSSLVFVIGMLALYPAVDRFEFDEDEGINYIKGRLIADGHSLYNEIWSDQPPLLSHLLALVPRVFGSNIAATRFVILAFSALLMTALLNLATHLHGRRCALVTAALLITLPHYARLSISVMVGLPAISLALAALAVQVRWHGSGSRGLLAASGALLALSAATKMFTLFLVPVLLVGAVAGGGRGSLQRAGAALAWLVGFGGTFGLLALAWLTPEALEQLIAPHAEAHHVAVYQDQNWHRGIDINATLLVLATAGAVMQLRRRRWLWLYPAVWSVVSLVILLTHTPVRYHQILLVSVPAALLAAVPVSEAVRALGRRSPPRDRALAILVVAVCGMVAGQHWPPLQRFLTGGDRGTTARATSERIVTDLRTRTDPDDWVVTDRLIYVVRADRPVPPQVAVLTGKRLRTGRIDEAMLLGVISRYNATAVLLARFPWESLPAALADEFDATRYDGLRVLYIRKKAES